MDSFWHKARRRALWWNDSHIGSNLASIYEHWLIYNSDGQGFHPFEYYIVIHSWEWLLLWRGAKQIKGNKKPNKGKNKKLQWIKQFSKRKQKHILNFRGAQSLEVELTLLCVFYFLELHQVLTHPKWIVKVKVAQSCPILCDPMD